MTDRPTFDALERQQWKYWQSRSRVLPISETKTRGDGSSISHTVRCVPSGAPIQAEAGSLPVT